MKENGKGSSYAGLSGSTLKIIALTTMILDHIGAVPLETYLLKNHIPMTLSLTPHHPLVYVYFALRLIGRLGFPLYIFLLVEGFMHTQNEWKYLGRMAVFCVLSEIPFDLAVSLSKSKILSGQWIEFGYQNVFFTLTIGLLVLILLRRIEQADLPIWRKCIGNILVLFIGVMLAAVLHTDYSAFGVIAIVLMYWGRSNPVKGMFYSVTALMVSSVLEVTAYFACLLVRQYNGTRGIRLKYFFYIVYPVHLFLLAMIRIWILW